jgi:23S rRNA (cytosine1962-C5)-methyltransferase
VKLPDLSHLLQPSDRAIALHVTPAAERAIRRGHSWLFDHAIVKQARSGSPGDLAVVFDRRNRFLTVGLYDPLSPIRVRVLQQRKQAVISQDWFAARLTEAAQERASLHDEHTTGYRLIHGESEHLPGLAVDRYEQTLVLKLYTLAWIPHLRDLLSALQMAAPAERLVLRLGRSVQAHPEHLYGLRDGAILFGPALDNPMVFRENGLRFEVDPVHGQKTGFFLDQRENRARAEQLANGKRVLDVFCYTGGFSVYAARGGAREVVSLDSSRPALEAAARNMALNREHPAVQACTHETLANDAFEALARLGQEGRRFDLVIVDPPAFAQKKTQVTGGLRAYGRLTRLALGVLQPGGTLVQASCSSRVSAEQFFDTVHRAAASIGRRLREIERTDHPQDHPVTFEEGVYLKCLFAVAP